MEMDRVTRRAGGIFLVLILLLLAAVAVGVVAGDEFGFAGDEAAISGDGTGLGGDGQTAAPSSGPGDTPATNGTDEPAAISYLSPPEAAIEQETHYSTGIDVATAVETDAQRLQGAYERHVFDTRRDEGIAELVAEDMVERINDWIIHLDEQAVQILAAYNNDEIATGTFLRELLRIQVAAAEAEELATHVNTVADIDTVPAAVREELIMLPDPALEEMAAGVRGAESVGSMYVQTADQAIVLGVADETYLRQATLRNERDRSLPNQFEGDDMISLINDRLNDLYPWATVSAFRSVGPASWEVSMDHPHTSITLYLDGGTTNVYHEIQEVQSDRIPVADSYTNTSEGVDVTVNTTAATGPMQVQVSDSTTGEPVQGTVSVDDRPVGTTGEDGTLWVVQPTGTFDVIVESTAGTTVTVTGS